MSEAAVAESQQDLPEQAEQVPPEGFHQVLTLELGKVVERRLKLEFEPPSEIPPSLNHACAAVGEFRKRVESVRRDAAGADTPADETLKISLRAARHAVREAERALSFEEGPPDHTSEESGLKVAQAEIELRELEERIAAVARQVALRLRCVGLALSGGGIRSATFNLGVLQALAQLRLLGLVDYLSTVSGGGYIGAWLAAWIKRTGEVTAVQEQLSVSRERQAATDRPAAKGVPIDDEPEPVYHLRAYSNYLSPELGLLSGDTWALFSIYLRNFLLNLLMLLPGVIALVVGVRLIANLYAVRPGDGVQDGVSWAIAAVGILAAAGTFTRRWSLSTSVLAGLTVAVAFLFLFALAYGRETVSAGVAISLGLAVPLACALVALHSHPRRVVERIRNALLRGTDAGIQVRVFRSFLPAGYPGNDVAAFRAATIRVVTVAILLPLLSAAVIGCRFLPPIAHEWQFGLVLGVIVLAGVLFGLLRAISEWLLAPAERETNGNLPAWRAGLLWQFACGLGSGAVAAALLYGLLGGLLPELPGEARVTLGPPLTLLVPVLAIAVGLALQRDVIQEEDREWYGTLCGYLLLVAAAWLVVFGVTIYGGWALVFSTCTGPALGALLPWGAVLTWLTATVGGALAGKSPRTATGSGNGWLEWLGRVAPAVFIIGLLAFVSLFVTWAAAAKLDPAAPSFRQGLAATLDNYRLYVDWLWAADGWRLFAGWIISLGLAVVLILCVDVNVFSLHNAYANRLIRCYLGASRPKIASRWAEGRGGAPTVKGTQVRREDALTGFDPADDILLSDLRIGQEHEGKQETYWGPLPIISWT
jgi:hypothetical protein